MYFYKSILTQLSVVHLDLSLLNTFATADVQNADPKNVTNAFISHIHEGEPKTRGRCHVIVIMI